MKGCWWKRGYTAGVETPDIPGEAVVPDAIDVLQGVGEGGLRKFKSVRQAQRFLGVHTSVSNLFNLGRHKVAAGHYRDLRISAFEQWGRTVT
jgi:hypothetical protein